MKKYITPIILVLIGLLLILLAGCSTDGGSENDEYITPEDFIQLNGLAAANGFDYPFTIDEAKLVGSVICPLVRTAKTANEFGINAYVALGPSFPTLTPNEIGEFAAYVAQYTCLDDALKLAEAVR